MDARYSPEACNQPGSVILNTANGIAASTLIISGFFTTLLQTLHGSDLITGLYTASTIVDRVLYNRITNPASTAPSEMP